MFKCTDIYCIEFILTNVKVFGGFYCECHKKCFSRTNFRNSNRKQRIEWNPEQTPKKRHVVLSKTWQEVGVDKCIKSYLSSQKLKCSAVKNLLQYRRPKFNSCKQKIPWRSKWQPAPVIFPGKPHDRGALESYSPQSCKESSMTGATKHMTVCH